MAKSKTAPSFDSLTCAISDASNDCMRGRWPELYFDQIEFLKDCPVNRNGWHYFQIPGGPVLHYKTGLDFRNPSVPYNIVKVGGRTVIALIGHPDQDEILLKEEGEWFSATKCGRTLYMPDSWQPSSEALSLYRRFTGGDGQAAYDKEPAAKGERMVLWAASLNGGSTEEDLRDNITYHRRNPGANKYRNVEDAVASYMKHIMPIHIRVRELGYCGLY
ncbi:MAG: hypothetical protein WAX66_02275 [Patescibacteria group bacterium]